MCVCDVVHAHVQHQCTRHFSLLACMCTCTMYVVITVGTAHREGRGGEGRGGKTILLRAHCNYYVHVHTISTLREG